MRPPDADPLILTAALDKEAAALFQRLRDRHFPTRLNIVPAHLTLFHHLPGDVRSATEEVLAAWSAGQTAMPFAARGFRFLGRGVAVAIEAEQLVAARRHLATLWADDLTPQDRQPFRPHITIQNKAEHTAARGLLARLEAEGLDVAGHIVGLAVWDYRGGPWELAGRLAFTA